MARICYCNKCVNNNRNLGCKLMVAPSIGYNGQCTGYEPTLRYNNSWEEDNYIDDYINEWDIQGGYDND